MLIYSSVHNLQLKVMLPCVQTKTRQSFRVACSPALEKKMKTTKKEIKRILSIDSLGSLALLKGCYGGCETRA